MKKYLLLFFIFATQHVVLAQTNIFKDSVFVSGKTYYGRNNYTIYHAGNIPLVFSAPHGGSQAPSEIPDRTYGTLGNDTRTKELAQSLRDDIISLTGKYPHVIISDLKRIKLDPNREPVEAAQGNQYAIQAWNEYQSFIMSARNTVNANFGKGFYIDLHGHGHSILRMELGYMLSSTDLDKSNTQLNTSTYINKSSIKNLANNNLHSLSFSDLLRGQYSFGSYLESEGYASVPSPTTFSPGSDPYFSGGYCTQQYGSVFGGTIDGIQIEHYYSGIRDSDTNIKNYTPKLTMVILNFLSYHYGFNLLSDVEDDLELAADYSLSQNYPNPFNPETVINYKLPIAGNVTLKVYDVLGREVATLVDGFKPAGNHMSQFSSRNLPAGRQGSQLPSGVYFYRLQTGNYIHAKKMTLLK